MTDQFFSRGFYSSKKPKGNDASDLSGSVGIELLHNFSNTVVVPVISQSFVHNLSVGVELFDNSNCKCNGSCIKPSFCRIKYKSQD